MAKSRWAIEQFYEDVKGECGLEYRPHTPLLDRPALHLVVLNKYAPGCILFGPQRTAAMRQTSADTMGCDISH